MVDLTDKNGMSAFKELNLVPVGKDRRKYQRVRLSRVAKLQCLGTGKYVPVRTNDLCPGGAQLNLYHATDLKAGDKVKLGLTISVQQAILSADSMINATVVRTESVDTTQQLALEFESEQRWLHTAA